MIPTDTAATGESLGNALRDRFSTSRRSASTSATYAPVMAAVRVPPSAWITSQSSVSVLVPSAAVSTAARSDRPISRWISIVRPLCFPLAASRADRVCVDLGSIPYSAVTHPTPFPIRWGGTFSSTEHVTSTLVLPNSTWADPSAWMETPVTSFTGRRSRALRWKERMRPHTTSLAPRAGVLPPGVRQVRLHRLGDGRHHAVLVLRVLQPGALLRVGEEPQLQQHGRAIHPQHVQRGLLHAAVLGVRLGDQPLVDGVRQPGRARVRLGPLQVRQDERQRIVRRGLRRRGRGHPLA